MSTPGDGQASGLPPEFSPRSGSTSAVRSGGRRGGGRILRRIAAVTSAFIVLGSATGFAVSQHYLGEVTQIDAFSGLTNRPEKVDVPAQNILIAGVDNRETLTPEQRTEYHVGHADYGKRSDTMILLHVSDKSKTATAISFPRDSLVTIPAYTDSSGTKHASSKNKLNAAYAFGGEKLAIATIEKATGIRIDHYVEVDLGGFVRMVNAVGGVDVCVSSAVDDTDSNLHLPAGKSHLNGVQGLAFVRARHIYANQDLGRIQAQQRFVGSMIKRATSKGVLLDPLSLNRFLSAVTKSLDTDMSKNELVDQIKRMRDYKPSDIKFLTVPIANSNGFDPVVGSVVTWNKAESKALFSKLKNDEPLEATAKTAKLTVPPGSITVQVLNGAGVQGLGSRAADDLAGLGFGMADIAKNADVTNQTATVVRYDPAKKQAAAQTVIAAIPGATGVPVAGMGKKIEIVIGSDYKGTQAVSVSTPSSTAKPKARTAADDICKSS